MLAPVRERVQILYGGSTPPASVRSSLGSLNGDGRDSPGSEGSSTPGSRPRRLRLSTLGRMGSQGRRESTRRTSVVPSGNMRRRSSAMAMPMAYSAQPQPEPQSEAPLQRTPMPSLHFERFAVDCSAVPNQYDYPTAAAAAVGESLRQILGTATALSPARAGGVEAGDLPGSQYVTVDRCAPAPPRPGK
eukprot:SAG11_NODE_5217_length_1627_cov_1.409031_2_plen_189_part_00